jgi:hypothetical protein
MTDRLPGGGKAWFVRERTATRYRIQPASKEGWIVTAVYFVGSALSVLLLLPRPTLTGWIVWGVMFAAWNVGLVVLALRMSVPTERS